MRLVAAGFRGSRRAAAQLPAAQSPCHPAPPQQAWAELLSLLQVHELNGIKIVTYCSPLYFANSEIFREKIIAKVSAALTHFCLQPAPVAPAPSGIAAWS